ncbi:MAG: outer membrane beta-barrel protein [Pseudomonadota bacterium]
MDIKSSQLLVSSALTVLLLANTATADQNSDSGIYVSGSVGQNWIQSGLPEENTAVLKAAVGWQLNPYLGIELSYDDLGEFPGPTPAYTAFDLAGVTAAVTGHLPLSENIALFAKAGQIWWSADSSFFFFNRSTGRNETGTLSFSESDALVGLGASYELSEQLELELEYNYYQFDFPGASLFNSENSALVLSLKWEL